MTTRSRTIIHNRVVVWGTLLTAALLIGSQSFPAIALLVFDGLPVLAGAVVCILAGSWACRAFGFHDAALRWQLLLGAVVGGGLLATLIQIGRAHV